MLRSHNFPIELHRLQATFFGGNEKKQVHWQRLREETNFERRVPSALAINCIIV
jgi:hypothetical protein